MNAHNELADVDSLQLVAKPTVTGLTHASVASVQVVVSIYLGANLVHFLQCGV